MKKKALIFALLVMGVFASVYSAEGVQKKSAWPIFDSQKTYPATRSLIGGYSDPISHWNVQQLKENLDKLVSDIGGWNNIPALLAVKNWTFALNSQSSSCPNCQPRYNLYTKFLKLDKGKLVCSHCKKTILPSEKFKSNHKLTLKIDGEIFDFNVYKSKTGMIYMLESYMLQLQIGRLFIGRRGILASLYLLYDKTKKDIYAERIIEILLSLAQRHKNLTLSQLTFHSNSISKIENESVALEMGGSTFHAMPKVERYWIYAYQSVRGATDIWKKFGDPETLKNKVKQFFIDAHEYLVSCHISGLGGTYYNMGNIFGGKLRSMAATAIYCDYPKALLDCSHFMNATAMQYSTFDGVEAESRSYQGQVVAALSRSSNAARKALKHALENGLIQKNSLFHKEILKSINKVSRVRLGNLNYPNGDTIRVGDTWGKHSMDKKTFRIKKFKADNGWGFFPLCSNDRAFLGLILPPRWFSHHHIDDLSIVLWGNGRELLPDYGYTKAFYRYFSTNSIAHNGSSVFWRGKPVLGKASQKLRAKYNQYKKKRPALPYPKYPCIKEKASSYAELIKVRKIKLQTYANIQPELNYKYWRRTAVYEYTPDGLVPSIDAASPGPVEKGVKFRNRMLMLIPENGKSSYLVDFHRIAGGDMHQIGIQAPFGEDSKVTCSAKKAKKAIANSSRTYWEKILGPFYKNSFRNVKVLNGSKPWTMEWVTSKSGISFKVWGTGSKNTLLLSGETPDVTRDKHHTTFTRSKNSPPKFRPHFYIRQEGAKNTQPNLQTVTPLIYEYSQVDQKKENSITNVQTIFFKENGGKIAESRKPFVVKVVFSSGRIDYLYSSYDNKVRTVAGLEFRGRGAWVSTMEKNGQRKPWAAVTLQNSLVKGNGLNLKSAVPQKLKIAEASYRTEGRNEIGTFRLKEIVKNPVKYIGLWNRADFGGDINNIYKIKNIKALQDSNETLVEINGRSGMEKRKSGWAYIGYPFKKGGKEAYLTLSDRAEYYSKEFLVSIKANAGEKGKS